MKKIVFILFLFASLSVACTSHAAKLPQGAYLDKYQWGALEDLLSDFRSNKISTNECALYGCYVLIAQEPSRSDSAAYAKLLPSKYDLGKISSAAGPYFFVKFLHDNINSFNTDVLKTFSYSEWSVFEILNNFTANLHIKEIIDNTPKIPGSFLGSQNIPFDRIARKVIEKQIMSTDEIYIIARIFVHNNDYTSIFCKYSNFFWNNHLTPSTIMENAYFDKLYIDKVSKTTNRKTVKLLNFLSHGCDNKYFVDPPR